MMVAIALLVFPKLALGLSGFETGVRSCRNPGRGRRHRGAPAGGSAARGKLLTTAALIMSGFLITTSLVTTMLIPAAEFQPGGQANGRALAYLAHDNTWGSAFGTIYDLSTIAILWFASASAMAGMLNLMPRYLPRYGMAPHWAGRSARWCWSSPRWRSL